LDIDGVFCRCLTIVLLKLWASFHLFAPKALKTTELALDEWRHDNGEGRLKNLDGETPIECSCGYTMRALLRRQSQC